MLIIELKKLTDTGMELLDSRDFAIHFEPRATYDDMDLRKSVTEQVKFGVACTAEFE